MSRPAAAVAGRTHGAPRQRIARVALRAAGALLVSLLPAACGGRRERLDVPRVTLDVPDQAPPPGGRITGHVAATDASGLTFLFVYACTADSVFRQGTDLNRARSFGFAFSLYVASTATAGEPVEVYAVANDDQGFYTDTAHSLAVGAVGAVGAAAATSLATRATTRDALANLDARTAAELCPRVIRARRSHAPAADAPTAPGP